MKFVNIIDPIKLESTLEKYVKEAYNEWDYLRCNNLVKHLLKVNSNNSVWLYYYQKLTPSLIKKTKYKWVGLKTWGSYLKDWKVYVGLFLLRLGFNK